jgi:hypothetical protein
VIPLLRHLIDIFSIFECPRKRIDPHLFCQKIIVTGRERTSLHHEYGNAQIPNVAMSGGRAMLRMPSGPELFLHTSSPGEQAPAASARGAWAA